MIVKYSIGFKTRVNLRLQSVGCCIFSSDFNTVMMIASTNIIALQHLVPKRVENVIYGGKRCKKFKCVQEYYFSNESYCCCCFLTFFSV